MEYKNSAGLYVGGISLILAGPLIVFIAVTFHAWMIFDNPSANVDGVFIGLGVFGGLLGIVGLILLIAATYRALVKIDAMQVMRPSASRENRPADHR
ncbi:hypothetical protein [Paeniglutamicibacter gangotriensis]|uniref:Uncharacterized protein n=1 Tax=Paeniglutamicibacter gangotriensis Lz1y TaxID=1276920 RepID=M7NBF7_9MICC|nr:hypothetical protein [Paeniglutamicibacter gangotriensis]EMQ99139.1 hypothetical protein ADIAG_01129 [Paeniglutamicibacter gangotriensis Lz1y]